MGVTSISGAAHGPISDYRFNWSNKSAIMRLGAIACHKVGGNAEDIVVYGEATAGEVIGPVLQMDREPTLTDYLPTDGDGVCSVAVAQRPARTNLILAANSGAVTFGDYLIPTSTVGAVIPRPAGSNIPPVARALESKADSASERYIYAEVLTPGIGTTGQRVSGIASDAPANAKSLNLHYTTLAASEVPLFVVPVAGIIRNLYAKMKTAPGAAKTVTYTVKKSSDGGATWSNTTLTCDVAGTNTSASDNAHAPAVAAGDFLAITITSADVGAAAGPTGANFIFE